MLNNIPHKYKIRVITFVCCFTLFSISHAQNQSSGNSDFWSNVQYGGGLGLSFGDGFFSAVVAPSAIYRFNEYMASGIGLNYSFSEERDVFKSSVIGASAIALFNPFYEIQLSTEFQQSYVNRDFDENFVSNVDDEYWYPALFLGIGYNANNITVGIQYDVLYRRNKSVYSEAWLPFVRFYF